MTDFETWWYHEGSDPKRFDEDFEEHCKRKCQIAWSNGAFMALTERKRWRYAGVTIWGGDATFTKVFTETEMKHAREPSELIKHAVQQCLDALASHDTKEQP
jgi:hypothetical protein